MQPIKLLLSTLISTPFIFSAIRARPIQISGLDGVMVYSDPAKSSPARYNCHCKCIHSGGMDNRQDLPARDMQGVEPSFVPQASRPTGGDEVVLVDIAVREDAGDQDERAKRKGTESRPLKVCPKWNPNCHPKHIEKKSLKQETNSLGRRGIQDRQLLPRGEEEIAALGSSLSTRDEARAVACAACRAAKLEPCPSCPHKRREGAWEKTDQLSQNSVAARDTQDVARQASCAGCQALNRGPCPQCHGKSH